MNEIMQEECLIPLSMCTYCVLDQINTSWPPFGGRGDTPPSFSVYGHFFLDSRVWLHWRQFIPIVPKGKAATFHSNTGTTAICTGISPF